MNHNQTRPKCFRCEPGLLGNKSMCMMYNLCNDLPLHGTTFSKEANKTKTCHNLPDNSHETVTVFSLDIRWNIHVFTCMHETQCQQKQEIVNIFTLRWNAVSFQLWCFVLLTQSLSGSTVRPATDVFTSFAAAHRGASSKKKKVQHDLWNIYYFGNSPRTDRKARHMEISRNLRTTSSRSSHKQY